MTFEQRHALRQTECPAILADIKKLLENPGKVFLPKSPLADAIAYTLDHCWAEQADFFRVLGVSVMKSDGPLCTSCGSTSGPIYHLLLNYSTQRARTIRGAPREGTNTAAPLLLHLPA